MKHSTDSPPGQTMNDHPTAVPAIVDGLLGFVAQEGPFDGVIGFSEGGRVGAMMMIREAQQPSSSSTLKCGIFFCALNPKDLEAVLQKDSTIRDLDHATDGILIKLPTAHIWSRAGGIHSGMGEDLIGLCQKGMREEVLHNLGHTVPGVRSSGSLKETIRAMERRIERAKSL